MTKPVGLVIVEIAPGSTTEETAALVQSAATHVPAGRMLVVCFELERGFVPSTPVEGVIVNEVLGSPKDRIGDAQWQFFGNLAVRVCQVKPGQRKVLRELGVVLICRVGEKAYSRKKSASSGVISASWLPGLHPVFTRDVANNVWHLPALGYKGKLRDRLSALMAWSDEKVLVITSKGRRSHPVNPLALDGDLVPVPNKQPYEWFLDL